MISLQRLTKKIKRFIIVSVILLVLAIGICLISFSINTNGSLTFLNAIKPVSNNIGFLAIGMGVIAAILVAFALNLSGEAAQSLTRNQLASPFTLGLTSTITLAYAFAVLVNGSFPIYYVALISFGLVFFLNILPIYLLSISKYQKNSNVFIFFGLAISVLLSGVISIINQFRNPSGFNILGWMIIETVTFSNLKFIVGSIFFGIGLLIFLLIIKKIYILENNYFKASTMGINTSLLNMIGLVSISFMCIGGCIIYAPFTLLGFALPFITKRYLIHNYDIRYSVFPSSLLSIIVTLLTYIATIYLHLGANVLMVIILSPVILWMMFMKKRKVLCG